MLRDLVKSMRPVHWMKNLLVFAGLVFAREAGDPELMLRAIIAFAAFCLVSSAVYLFNDVVDAARDGGHPLKSGRPVASGRLSRATAGTFSFLLAVVGLAVSIMLPLPALLVVHGYFFLNLLYSLKLKKLVIIDVMTVALGFVLRVLVGTLAVDVPASHWLLICTFLLALFLGFGKRRHELTLLREGAVGHRDVLAHYSPLFLDQMIAVVTPSTLVCYVLYSVSPETVGNVGSRALLVTFPFVIYGIFRYLYLVHERKLGGDPAVLLVRDPWLAAAVAGWVVAVLLVLY